MAINIGMAFSGGGYRAATFNLGTLSFLNSVKLDDSKTLLDCVVALSSVSGGTIPAMKYMLTRARNESVDKMVEEVVFLDGGKMLVAYGDASCAGMVGLYLVHGVVGYFNRYARIPRMMAFLVRESLMHSKGNPMVKQL